MDNWLEQLRLENTAAHRTEINAMVRRYCRTSGTPYQDCWRECYGLFTQKTGMELNKNKLDTVIEAGKLDTLFQVVQQCTRNV